jgi:hypothetical protein
MTHREVWAALRGDKPSSYYADAAGIAPPGVELCQAKSRDVPEPPADEDPQTKTGSGGEGAVVLEYSDPIALAPNAQPLQAYDAYGDGYCGPDGCPPRPDQRPQYDRDRLFPSLPDNRRDDQPSTTPGIQAFTWREMLPWVVLGLVVVAFLPRLIDRIFPRSTPPAAKRGANAA